MSYDLVVFSPTPDLRDRGKFIAWYESRTNWQEGLDYNDPSNASLALQAWFREMISTFPSLNGPLRVAPDEIVGGEWAADYAICTDIIYVAFPSGKGGIAYETSRRLAAKYGVGFFDASGGGEAWYPTDEGTLEVVHRGDGGDRSEAVIERLLGQLQRAASRHKK